MWETIGLEILIILALVLANGFFAASELAIVSARHSRLEQKASEGHKGARQALELAETPDRFLATVQVGITLIGTFAAAFGGARLGDALAAWLSGFPAIEPYAEPVALGIVILLITYLSLVLGELAPKRLALQHAERIASVGAPVMMWLSVAARPAVALLSASVGFVLRLLGQRKAADASVTAEDIVYMVREGEASGTVESAEADFIDRVFRFGDRIVRAVMTPRTEIVAVDVDTHLADVVDIFMNSGFTRLPVYQESLDRVMGVLHAKDLLQVLKTGTNIDITQLLRPATFVLASQHIDDILNMFRRQHTHLALVIDEFGQVVGLLTMEDILEELVGEIEDEDDVTERPFVRREDGSWLVDASVVYEDAQERLDLPEIAPEEKRLFVTLGGMVLSQMERIPAVGDSIKVGRHVLEVVDMDGRRIDKVLVRPNGEVVQNGEEQTQT